MQAVATAVEPLVPLEDDYELVKSLPYLFGADRACVVCSREVKVIGELDVMIGECPGCGQDHRVLDLRPVVED